MSIEEHFASMAQSLQIIATIMSSGSAATAQLGTPDTAAPAAEGKGAKGKAAGTTAKPPAPGAAAGTPAASTPAASPASSSTAAPSWKDAHDAIVALNKSTGAGHGREGVKALCAKFGVTLVKDLEALKDKYPEMIAFAKGLLEPAAAAADNDDPFA